MNKIIENISNAKNKTTTIVNFIIKNFIILPFKIFIVLLLFVAIIVSCDVKSATPWEQIPFSIPPVMSEVVEYRSGDGVYHSDVNGAYQSNLDQDLYANCTSYNSGTCHGFTVINEYNGGLQISIGWEDTINGELLQQTPFVTALFTRTETKLNCGDTNYPFVVYSSNNVDIDSCNRGQCPSSDNTNSEFDFVVSRSGGTPTEDQVQAVSQKCMPIGAGGTHCVVEATRFTDSSGYNNDYYTQQNSGTHESTGQVCGDLVPNNGNATGTTASGTEDADFCFFSGGSMNCYREPDEVCPDGNCIPGCASMGGEAWCVTSGFPTDGSGNPGNPPFGFGSGGAGTGDTSGGDGGNGDGSPGGDSGGSSGGGSGGGDAGNGGDDDDPNDNPECEPTANTVCGENDFYDPNDWDNKNFGTVMMGFQDRVLNSSIGSATANFFDISASGTCEVWSVTTSAFTVVFDQHCSSIMTSIFPFIHAIIIALASFVSFRWAFL